MNTFNSESELLYNEKLMDTALEQIIDSCRAGDFEAVYELLESVDAEVLEGFIPEEKLMEIRG
jgi:hypothetical protein